MRRVILTLTAAALTCVGTVKAQGRIQAGINLANVSINDNGSVDEANTLTSFNVGLVGDFKLASILYLQPGVLYTGKGSKIQSGDENSATYYKAVTNPRYVEVPVNLVFKLPLGGDTKFFVGAGPYAAVGVGGKNKVEGKVLGAAYSTESKIEFSNDDPTTLNEEEGAAYGKLKRFDYGLNGVVGLDGKSVVLSAGYGLGLAKINSGADNNSNDSNKNRVWSISLGFKF